MLSDDITLDKLIEDIDQQIEILLAIAADNPILVEQLRLLHESREYILFQELENHRLLDLIDPIDEIDRDDLVDHATMMEQHANDS